MSLSACASHCVVCNMLNRMFLLMIGRERERGSSPRLLCGREELGGSINMTNFIAHACVNFYWVQNLSWALLQIVAEFENLFLVFTKAFVCWVAFGIGHHCNQFQCLVGLSRKGYYKYKSCSFHTWGLSLRAIQMLSRLVAYPMTVWTSKQASQLLLSSNSRCTCSYHVSYLSRACLKYTLYPISTDDIVMWKCWGLSFCCYNYPAL